MPIPVMAAAAIGAGVGALGGLFGGKKGKVKQASKYTPQQILFMQNMLEGSQPGMLQGMDYLTKMISGDESAYAKFEKPYMTQFNQEIIPALAERFAGMDAQSSSAFGQALGGAGAGLMENLAALREGLRSQALSQLQGMSGIGLQQQFENYYQPAQASPMATIMPAIGKIIGAGLGGGFGGGGVTNTGTQGTNPVPNYGASSRFNEMMYTSSGRNPLFDY